MDKPHLDRIAASAAGADYTTRWTRAAVDFLSRGSETDDALETAQTDLLHAEALLHDLHREMRAAVDSSRTNSAVLAVLHHWFVRHGYGPVL